MVALAFASRAGAASFRSDPAFGSDGTVIPEHPGIGRDVAAQQSGRIVVLAADETQLIVLGLSRDGAPDPSFGDGGITALPGTTSWYPGSSGRLSVDDADRIVVSATADGALFVARLLESGTPDRSFGDGGMAGTPLPQCVTEGCRPGATGLAIDAEGRIVAATSWEDAGGTGIALVRLTRDGMLDETFGASGVAHTETVQYDRPGGIAIAADGRIFAVATRLSVDGAEVGAVIAAFAPDGALDPRFAHDGTAFVELPGGGSATDVALDARGRLLVVGSAHPRSDERQDVMVQRWLPSGVPDRTFGTHGVAFDGADDFGRPNRAFGTEVLIEPDGTIVASGHAVPRDGRTPCAFFSRTAIATFGSNGVPGAGNTRAAPGGGFAGTTLLPDGALLGVGSRFPPCHVVDQPPRIVLSRLLRVSDPRSPSGPIRIRPRGAGTVPGGTAR